MFSCSILKDYVGQHEILALNMHAELPSGARGLNFGQSSSASILCVCMGESSKFPKSSPLEVLNLKLAGCIQKLIKMSG